MLLSARRYVKIFQRVEKCRSCGCQILCAIAAADIRLLHLDIHQHPIGSVLFVGGERVSAVFAFHDEAEPVANHPAEQAAHGTVVVND